MSCDHLFVDLQAAKPTAKRGDLADLSVAVVRTNGHGKVLGAVANKGDLRGVLAAIDSLVVPFPMTYIVVAVKADQKRAALREACEAALTADPFKGRAWLDFGQVAWPLALADLVPNRSLETIGAHFHVKRGSHAGTLTGDCSYLAEVYWTMAQSYRTALAAEHAVSTAGRNIGGDAFSFLRKVAGI